jgi:hypothetical protein
MIGMNPFMRIELARDYRQGQIDAAAKRRIAADAAASAPAPAPRGAHRVKIPRLRPQQLRP